MKITYLRLVNFAGIYAGLGLSDVTIDFKNAKHKITLLNGVNGSGKSCLLSNLNPYRETFDARKTIIRTDEDDKLMDGYKEIHYEAWGKKVVIKHYFGETSAKNKAYIEVDGKELNENGNIRSFNTAMEATLKVTKDYFTVGRLGDNVTNFINFKTSKRKDYINTFVPNIDPYMEAFQTASTKFQAIKNNFNSLNSEISNYAEYHSMEENLKSIDSIIKQAEEQVDEAKAAQTKTESKIAENKDELDETGINTILPDSMKQTKDLMNKINYVDGLILKAKGEVKSYTDKLEEVYTNSSFSFKEMDKDQLQEYVNGVKNKLYELQVNSNKYQEQADSMKEDLVDLKNQEQIKINSLQSLNNGIDSELLLEQKKKTTDQLTEVKESVEETDKNTIYDLPLNKLNGMKNVYDNFISYYQTVDDAMTEDLKTEFNQGKTFEAMATELNQVEKAYNEHFTQYQGLAKDKANLESSPELLDALTTHPDKCNLGDSCPFMLMMLKTKDQWSSLDDLGPMLDKLETELNEEQTQYKSKQSALNALYAAANGVNQYYQTNKEIIDELIKDPGSKDVNYFLKESSAERYQAMQIDRVLQASINYVNEKNNIDELQKSVDNIDLKLEMFRKDETQAASLNKEIADIQAKYQDKEAKLDTISTALTKAAKMINTQKYKIDIVNNIIDLRKTYTTAKENLDKLDDVKSRTNTISSAIKDNTVMLSSISNQLNEEKLKLQSIKNDRDKLKEQMAIVGNLQKRLEEINDVYKYFSIIKDAVNPKKGIPLVFSNIYLKSIAETANELLNIAYDGSFSIDIELTAKDFFVHVYKDDGTMLEDILEASQGEQSLTNLSLSLALLIKVTQGYNILYLDEVDGVLSTDNRAKFIEMLNTQIENLDIDQVFVISHNDSFYSSDLDLILLKGNTINLDDESFMQGKNVIFNIEDTKEKSSAEATEE